MSLGKEPGYEAKEGVEGIAMSNCPQHFTGSGCVVLALTTKGFYALLQQILILV